MLSIPEKVEEIVGQSPYLREGITDKLLNLSALARKIKPEIEKDLMKKVSEEAVFMALQRYAKSVRPYYHVDPADYLANLGLRSGLFELTVKNSPGLLKKLAILAEKVSKEHAVIFIFTQGLNETTIITAASVKKFVLNKLKDEEVNNIIDNLTGITLQRTHDQIETTGVLQYPLRVLAWQGISVIEIYTTLNDIMVIVRNFEVDRAIISLRQALEPSRN